MSEVKELGDFFAQSQHQLLKPCLSLEDLSAKMASVARLRAMEAAIDIQLVGAKHAKGARLWSFYMYDF